MIKYLKETIPKWVYWIGIFITLSGFLTTVTIKFQEIKENRGFNEVLFGLLLAEMEPVDSLEYYTFYGKEKVEVKLRTAGWSQDIYVFVQDGKMWIYSGHYNKSEGKYSFIDFGGNYHLIHKR